MGDSENWQEKFKAIDGIWQKNPVRYVAKWHNGERFTNYLFYYTLNLKKGQISYVYLKMKTKIFIWDFCKVHDLYH